MNFVVPSPRETEPYNKKIYCPLGISRLVPQDQRSLFWCFITYNKSFIDQDGWILPRSCFACLWISTSSRSINTQEMNLANIQPSWPHAWSITHVHSSTQEHLFAISLQCRNCRRILVVTRSECPSGYYKNHRSVEWAQITESLPHPLSLVNSSNSWEVMRSTLLFRPGNLSYSRGNSESMVVALATSSLDKNNFIRFPPGLIVT